jgi:hypothetical protein
MVAAIEAVSLVVVGQPAVAAQVRISCGVEKKKFLGAAVAGGSASYVLGRRRETVRVSLLRPSAFVANA